ncbi:hypothetical protein AAF712_000982 [Marasmius tenuissimus]|uniref:Uncharacterized protein n=1 Tax=Marasmius tenuissimus TaxID=585030 RepID=A0ABR3AF46_9AGAR
MAPPGLTFTRECKCSMDVNIRLIPRATGVEMVHQRGHIFLLSDLFLVCERMTSQERAEHGANGADMWLMFPPLSGKVLRLSDVPGQDNALQVHIMRKETITLTAETLYDRNTLYHELKECIEFAASVGPISKQAPPPVPPLPGLSQSTSAPFPASTSPGRDSDSSSTTPGTRTSSPPSLNDSQGFNRVSTTPDKGPSPRSSSGMDSITNQFSSMAMGPQRMSPSGPYPPMASPPPSIGPGQVLRNRSLSQGPGSPPPSMGPGQIFGKPSLPHGPGSPVPSVGPGQVFRNPSMSHGPGSPPPSIGPGQIFRNPSMSHGPGSPPPSVGPGQVMERTRTISLGHGSNQASPPSMSRPSSGPHPPHQPPMHPPNHPHSQQMFAPQPMHRPYGPNGEGPLPPVPPRPPSEPNYNVIRKSPSTRSLGAPRIQEPSRSAPPMPHLPPNGLAPHYNQGPSHPGPSHPFTPPRPGPGMRNMSPGPSPNLRPTLPSSQFRRAVSGAQSFADPSPPTSPVEETPRFSGPTTLTISADMKCKVFLKQQHAQWKSLGTARLKLYRQSPTNVKQLVVEADSKDRQVLISTIVLTDGVERVGKTGVAVELSDKGARTGIVYMLQLRNDEAAGGFFDSLLEGSDRSGLR